MLDHLRCHHLSHIGTSGRIPDHAGPASDQGNRLVSCHLQALHQTQSHEMTYMQAVCGRIKTDIEGSLSLVYHFFNFFFVRNLRDQTAGYQLLVTIHSLFPPLITKKSSSPAEARKDEGRLVLPPYFTDSSHCLPQRTKIKTFVPA